MNKNTLYKSLMENIAKEVKKSLNEAILANATDVIYFDDWNQEEDFKLSELYMSNFSKQELLQAYNAGELTAKLRLKIVNENIQAKLFYSNNINDRINTQIAKKYNTPILGYISLYDLEDYGDIKTERYVFI